MWLTSKGEPRVNLNCINICYALTKCKKYSIKIDLQITLTHTHTHTHTKTQTRTHTDTDTHTYTCTLTESIKDIDSTLVKEVTGDYENSRSPRSDLIILDHF